MHIPPNNYRCPLGRLQSQTLDREAIKQQGWREDGILVISPDDERLDWAERELITRLGQRLYGSRDHNGSNHG